jgi:hypothetical protein
MADTGASIIGSDSAESVVALVPRISPAARLSLMIGSRGKNV